MAIKLLETRVLHTVLVNDAVVTGQGRLGSKLADAQPPAPLSLGHLPLPTYSDERSDTWRTDTRIPPTGDAVAEVAAARAGRPEWGFGHSGSRSLARSASQTVSKRFAGSLLPNRKFNGPMNMCPADRMRAVSTRGPM
jgi:hypothetical protein